MEPEVLTLGVSISDVLDNILYYSDHVIRTFFDSGQGCRGIPGIVPDATDVQNILDVFF